MTLKVCRQRSSRRVSLVCPVCVCLKLPLPSHLVVAARCTFPAVIAGVAGGCHQARSGSSLSSCAPWRHIVRCCCCSRPKCRVHRLLLLRAVKARAKHGRSRARAAAGAREGWIPWPTSRVDSPCWRGLCCFLSIDVCVYLPCLEGVVERGITEMLWRLRNVLTVGRARARVTRLSLTRGAIF